MDLTRIFLQKFVFNREERLAEYWRNDELPAILKNFDLDEKKLLKILKPASAATVARYLFLLQVLHINLMAAVLRA
ncbi:MAG: hypothetical protein ACXW04_12080 [Methylobacter sp.]